MTQSTDLDPNLFEPSAIAAETAAFNEQLEAALASQPRLETLKPQQIRDAREAGKGTFGQIERSEMATERSIPGPGGDIPLRLFVPDRVEGVYLFFHGGGFTIGRAHHQDPRLESTARNAHVAVISVDYRKAPEDPFPAGPDDCEAAALWLVQRAKAEFGSERILIGGESAGAYLSALTLLRMRDKHQFTGFAGANLVYGAYDLSMTPSLRRWGERYLILSTPLCQWFSDQFVSHIPRDRWRDPDLSPLYADLAQMPPALFSVGTLDPLLDESLFMYTRWIAAANQAELAIYPGGAHAFNMFPIALARKANERMERFIAATGLSELN